MTSPFHNPIRRACQALVVASAAGLPFLMGACQSQAANAALAQRNPVLVELFTSEGCSDCPPADALLARLDATQSVPGAQAIVLSEHVTYWNYLGWRDPFSFGAMDERQQRYAEQFALSSVATPQFVVDGSVQIAGADPIRLNRAIARAAASPKLEITIADAHRAANGSVLFSARTAANTNAALVAALAENATHSEVARGENAGRTLNHVAVVRVFKEFGSDAADGRPLQLPRPNPLNTKRDDGPLRLVVFLVSYTDGHVIAVAEQTLGR